MTFGDVFERFLSLYGVYGEFSVNLWSLWRFFWSLMVLGFLWNGSERVDGGTWKRDRAVRRFWRILKPHEILIHETKKPSVHGWFKS